MKKLLTLTLLAGSMVPQSLFAQEVDRTKYPDFSAKINPDASLMRIKNTRGQRPAYVNNAETKHFPPVFNQDGGSCGSASRICYMFTHELNAFRNLDGKDPNNYYPSHFVWLLTNGNSVKTPLFSTSVCLRQPFTADKPTQSISVTRILRIPTLDG